MKLNVYGKLIEANRHNSQWIVFYLGNEGKKRLANNLHVPNNIPEEQLITYLADLCHEWATPKQNQVKILS